MLLLGMNDTVFKKAHLLLVAPLLQQLKPAFDVICQASRYTSEQEIMRLAQHQQSERNIRLEFQSKISALKLGSKTKAANTKVTNTNTKINTKELLQELSNNQQLSDDDEALAMPLWLKWAFTLVILVAILAGIWVGLST